MASGGQRKVNNGMLDRCRGVKTKKSAWYRPRLSPYAATAIRAATRRGGR
jgi:hypothetical protein